MTLQDFYDITESLNDEGLKEKWETFCENLKNLDVTNIRYLIEDCDILSTFVELESDDFFGTEGMNI